MLLYYLIRKSNPRYEGLKKLSPFAGKTLHFVTNADALGVTAVTPEPGEAVNVYDWRAARYQAPYGISLMISSDEVIAEKFVLIKKQPAHIL